MAILLHLNNFVLFLFLFDYSSQEENNLEQSTTNVGCIINWNKFPSHEDEFWNKTILTLGTETNATKTNLINATKTHLKNLYAKCRKGSHFKIGGGFEYKNKTYLDSNTFNCVNGTLQDTRERRFSRQNIDCHEKLLCGGQNLPVGYFRKFLINAD